MSTGTKIRVGAWSVDPDRNALERDGRKVRLEPRAMDVLVTLASSGGEVVSVETLLKSVWKGVVVTDSSVYLAIRQLREALTLDGDAEYIETIPKRGYRLLVPVGAPVADVPVPARPARGPVPKYWIAVAAIALLAGAAADYFIHDSPPQTVVVLPFDELSSGAGNDYLAAGITIEVTHALARIEDLRVIGRTSAFQFKKTAAPPGTANGKLGADYVLSGSLRRTDSLVRVTAQLDDARTGVRMWSGTVERPFDDLFAIEDELARQVAVALQIRLHAGELAKTPGMTRNVAAYDEYLRGIAANLEWRDASFDEAIVHLQRAVELDPQFTLAWAELSIVAGNAAGKLPERAAALNAIGESAVRRAQALAPDEPPVLLALAIHELRRKNWSEGARLYDALENAYGERGIGAHAAGPRGIFLLAVGRIREALPHLERARAQDPLAPAYALFLAEARIAARDYAGAAAEADRGLALEGLDQSLQSLALRAAMNAHDPEAIRRRAAALEASAPDPVRAELVSLLDSRESALALIRRSATAAASRDKLTLGEWAAYFGDTKLALELVLASRPDISRPGLLWEPLLGDTRVQPGFSAYLDSTGIVAFWRTNGWPDMCRPLEPRGFHCF